MRWQTEGLPEQPVEPWRLMRAIKGSMGALSNPLGRMIRDATAAEPACTAPRCSPRSENEIRGAERMQTLHGDLELRVAVVIGVAVDVSLALGGVLTEGQLVPLQAEA